MGIAAVQAVSVESMAQLAAKIDNSAIKEGQEIFVRCGVFNKNTDNRHHRKAGISIDAVQVATADDKTDDEVVFLIALRNMKEKNNTVRATIWTPSDGVTPKQIRDAESCELPTPAPTYIADTTVITTDNSSNVGISITIAGTDLSLWDSRDIFDGTRFPMEKLAVFLDAADDDGIVENIGCCFMQSEGDDESKMVKEFNDVYGPLGMLAPQTLVQATNEIDDKFCDQKEDPSPAPAADVNVVDVQTETTDTNTTAGTVTLANSVMDGVSPTETVIPRIFSIAPVTTADGFCAGFDLVYDPAVDVDMYDTGNASLVVGTPVPLNDETDLKIITSVMSSPDQ